MYSDPEIYMDIISPDEKIIDLETKIIDLLKSNNFSISKSHALFDKILRDFEKTPINEL